MRARNSLDLTMALLVLIPEILRQLKSMLPKRKSYNHFSYTLDDISTFFFCSSE